MKNETLSRVPWGWLLCLNIWHCSFLVGHRFHIAEPMYDSCILTSYVPPKKRKLKGRVRHLIDASAQSELDVCPQRERERLSWSWLPPPPLELLRDVLFLRLDCRIVCVKYLITWLASPRKTRLSFMSLVAWRSIFWHISDTSLKWTNKALHRIPTS